MAIRQREFPGAAKIGPSPLRVFVRKQWRGLSVLGGVVMIVLVAWALREGMARNADQKASGLYSAAKTAEDFRMILAQVPRSYLTFDIMMNVGNALHDQGKVEEARAQYKKISELYSQGWQAAAALCALGILDAEKKDFAKAGAFFKRAVESDPAGAKAPEALYQWGRSLQALGYKAAAREKFESVTRDFPSDTLSQDAASRAKRLNIDSFRSGS